MRFVSKYGAYQLCYQRDVVEHYATGESRILKPLLNLEFAHYGAVLAWEEELARSTFINRGTNVELDGVTTVDPSNRFSVLDTVVFAQEKGMSVEDREKMERWLLNEDPDRPNIAYGRDYLHADAPRIPAPWPTYDSFRGVKGAPTGERIAAKVAEDGYDVQLVLAYERANQNRQDVIDALEALTVPAEFEEYVSA